MALILFKFGDLLNENQEFYLYDYLYKVMFRNSINLGFIFDWEDIVCFLHDVR